MSAATHGPGEQRSTALALTRLAAVHATRQDSSAAVKAAHHALDIAERLRSPRIAWIIHGLADRTDVDVVTVDNDHATAALAAQLPWPPYVRLVVGDAVHVTAQEGTFDLIFADAQGGKWDGLEGTIAALRPGGQLLLDDMTPTRFADAHHEQKTIEVRTRVLGHPDLVSVPIAWSTGLILSTRRRT